MANQNRTIPWALISGLALLALAFILGSWLAGHSSGAMEAQRLRRQLNSLEDQLATARTNNSHYSTKTPNFDNPEAVDLRAELQHCQAEANQYRAKLEDEFVSGNNDRQLAAAMLTPDALVQTLHPAEAESKATGYIIVVPHTKVVILASHLRSPRHDRQFQLWAIPKEAAGTAPSEPSTMPNPQSAALLPGREANVPLYLEIEDASLASDPMSFAITEEPLGGSNEPTGPKILVSAD